MRARPGNWLERSRMAEHDAVQRARIAALNLVRERGEVYSREVADALPVHEELRYRVSRAQKVLAALEAEGVLVSVLRIPLPGEGGFARNYYRLAEQPGGAA